MSNANLNAEKVIEYTTSLGLFFRAVQALPNWIHSPRNITVQNLLMEESREASYYLESIVGIYSRKLLCVLNQNFNTIDSYDHVQFMTEFYNILNTVNWHVIRAKAAVAAYIKLDVTQSAVYDPSVLRLGSWAEHHQQFVEAPSLKTIAPLLTWDEGFKHVMSKPVTHKRFNIIPE